MGAACMRGRGLEALLRDGIAAAGDYSDCSSEVLDSESDISSSSGNFVALDVTGFLKRTYGVAALSFDSSLKRRPKSAKLDEQLVALQAVLPDGAARSKEQTAIVLDACHYIVTLQSQVEDLKAELQDDASTNSTHTRPDELHCEGQWNLSYQGGEPVMDVAKRNGLLEVTIVCGNRPGLLVDIMEAIECLGLTILHTRIACRNEILVEHFSLEMNEETQGAEGQEERVKAMVLQAICQGPLGSHRQRPCKFDTQDTHAQHELHV